MAVASSTKILSYEEAAAMVGQPFTCFNLINHRQHISLSPKYIGKISEGIHETLKIELNRYSKSMEGIPVAYSKPKCIQRCGSIMDESPYLHFDVEVNFVVFKPTVGSLLLGKVNKLGEDHVGCLVHGIFNASIHRPHNNRQANWARRQLSGGDEFQFEVTGLQTRSGIVSLLGKMPATSAVQKSKRKRNEVSISSVDNLSAVSSGTNKKRKKNRLADQSFETTSTDMILNKLNLDAIDSSFTDTSTDLIQNKLTLNATDSSFIESNSKSQSPQTKLNHEQPSQSTSMDTSEQNIVLLDASGQEKKKKKKKKKDKNRDLESSSVDKQSSNADKQTFNVDKQSRYLSCDNLDSSLVKNDNDNINSDIESIKVKQEKDLFFTGVDTEKEQGITNSDYSSSKEKKKKKEKVKREAASLNSAAFDIIKQESNTCYLDSGIDVTSPGIYNCVNVKQETDSLNILTGESKIHKKHKKKSKKVKKELESS